MTLAAAELNRWEHKHLALAAVAQCAVLVQDLAGEGKVPNKQLAACVNPLSQMTASSINEVYPELPDLSRGLQILHESFARVRIQEHRDIIQYTLGMLLLRKNLMSDSEMQETLGRRLQYLDPFPADEMPLDLMLQPDENEDYQYSQQERILEQLGNLYKDTISTLSFRIVIKGKVDNLKNERIANGIRALLLAGIRSAVLWHQLGGRRWQLLFYRKRSWETVSALRDQLMAANEESL